MVRYELSHFYKRKMELFPFKHVLQEFIPDMEVSISPKNRTVANNNRDHCVVDWRKEKKISILCESRPSRIHSVHPSLCERHSEVKRKRTIHNYCSGQTQEHSCWEPFTNWDDWYHHSSYCKQAVSLKNHLYRHSEDYPEAYSTPGSRSPKTRVSIFRHIPSKP